jgi:hypothetical protein
MDDACFTFDFSLDAGGILLIQIAAYGAHWTCTFDRDDDSLILLRNGRPVWLGRLTEYSPTGDLREFRIAFIDHQVFLTFPNSTLIAYSESTVNRSGLIGRPFLWFEAVRGTGAIAHVGIERDIYYYDPRFSDGNTPEGDAWKIPANSFFVVGDNVPISKDSRHWNDPFLDRTSIVGQFEIMPQNAK